MNSGARAVTIDATFGYMPFISATLSEESKLLPVVDLSSLSALILGGVLLIARLFHNQHRNRNSCNRSPKNR
jgi:hypothetical protein